MTRAQLLELIANGDNSGVEFKRDHMRPEQIAKEIVALANCLLVWAAFFSMYASLRRASDIRALSMFAEESGTGSGVPHGPASQESGPPPACVTWYIVPHLRG